MADDPREQGPRTEDETEDTMVVADMNVEGMPWYRPDAPRPKNPDAEEISKKNLWRYTFAAVKAGLLIVFVFGLAGALFIWFCTNVWLR